jgi:hypothetical protein
VQSRLFSRCAGEMALAMTLDATDFPSFISGGLWSALKSVLGSGSSVNFLQGVSVGWRPKPKPGSRPL